MLYILICYDKPETGLERRMAARPDHLAYLESAEDKVRIGGAMLTPDEKSPLGSVIVIEADSIEEARAFAQADPYAKADVFSDVEIYPWRQAAGVVKVG
ncbi:MAG: YciI family protein [Hyphomicrobiales bacterium]|nr:YciI family protein [Hyphomicrobiales bacterium]